MEIFPRPNFLGRVPFTARDHRQHWSTGLQGGNCDDGYIPFQAGTCRRKRKSDREKEGYSPSIKDEAGKAWEGVIVIQSGVGLKRAVG